MAFFATVLACAGGAVAAPSALAAGTPFQRGALILTTSAGTGEYSPDGTLVQMINSAVPGGTTCFSPDAKYLVEIGVGLYDSSGNPLPSEWAAANADYSNECAVDGFGHVYTQAAEYTITGHQIKTLAVPYHGNNYQDLAPDQCTIYYGGADASSAINRFNVCTNSTEPAFTNGFPVLARELRVLPNWNVAVGQDEGWALLNPLGQGIAGNQPDDYTTSAGAIALDPDGTSIWFSAIHERAIPAYRYLIRSSLATGQVITQWQTNAAPSAIFGPPLFGNAEIPPVVDSNPAGRAEAFRTTVGYSSTMSSLDVYVDGSSTASQAIVGVYSDKAGHPATLLTQGTITPRAASRNYVQVAPVAVTAGERLWIAILAPPGAGKLRFRDTPHGAGSETSAQSALTALPATWQTGTSYTDGDLSAYGD